MSGGSLRLRLWSAAAVSIILALAIAGIGLRYLFERHVERRITAELTVDLNQLIGATTFATNGSLTVAPVLTDPRFATPLSGYYWQAEEVGGRGSLLRSRSLWDATLSLPSGTNADGKGRVQELPGPGGALLVAAARTIIDPGGRSFRAIVAEDHRTVELSVEEYLSELAPALLLLGVVLIIAIFVQVTVGLAPLEALRAAVSGVVARPATRLQVNPPREVQPLADEINRLLEAQEKALKRARSGATDLAHGLKTPLQVISGDIRALRAKGEAPIADEIEKSVATIRRHIDRELARARVAPGISGECECRVGEVALRIIDVVKRTPGSEKLSFAVEVPGSLTAPIDEGDLSEILGNVIENASRFAASTIRVTAESGGDGTLVSVSDDGSGIIESERELALSRGVRLDTGGSGTGLGLAIVSDIVDAYGGRLTLADARPGLRVSILLPRTPLLVAR